MEENAIKLVLAAAAAALMTYLAQLIIPIAILCVVMLLDYITGVHAAYTDDIRPAPPLSYSEPNT